MTSVPNLSTILKKTSLDDHTEVLKASNAALKASKHDIDAQHIKLVALLKLDRYEEAVHFLDEAGDPLKSRALVEHAYALYKTGQPAEAAEIASEAEDQRGAQQVEAQARYRAEDFAEAALIYKKLSSSPSHGEDFDLKVNSSAVNAQLHWTGAEDVEMRKAGREDLEAFETAYNAACACVARGELAQAEILLKRAKQICQHSEDLTPEQRTEELLPIIVQQLYVLQSLGKTSEAEALVPEIHLEQISDLSTKKIAQNNLSVISSLMEDPFLTHKKFHSIADIPARERPFAFQRRSLASSKTSIDLKAFKTEGVASSTLKEMQKHPTPSTSPEIASLSALYASAVAKNEVGAMALKKVLPELEKRPNDVGLILTIVQLYVSTGNYTAATQLMQNFLKRLEESASDKNEEVRYSPGLLTVLLGLYRVQGRNSQITQELAKAASYWRHRSKAPPELLLAAGVSLLESTNTDDIDAAQEIFTKLYEQRKEDPSAIAGYVASHASQASKSQVEQLSSVADLIQSVDVDALEQAGIPQASNALAIAQGTSRKRKAADEAPGKPKRIRKSRLPKDYDPNKKPDPERWLPLRDRSTYRPRGKKKGRKGGGDDRTQGGIVAEDVGVDTTAKAQASGGVSGSGTVGNKKKKAKGKR